jgi:hypothetical protein
MTTAGGAPVEMRSAYDTCAQTGGGLTGGGLTGGGCPLMQEGGAYSVVPTHELGGKMPIYQSSACPQPATINQLGGGGAPYFYGFDTSSVSTLGNAMYLDPKVGQACPQKGGRRKRRA